MGLSLCIGLSILIYIGSVNNLVWKGNVFLTNVAVVAISNLGEVPDSEIHCYISNVMLLLLLGICIMSIVYQLMIVFFFPCV